MTGSRYLLDTNIVSAWLKGESAVVSKIQSSGEIHMPVIVVGELYFGAHYSGRVEKNIENLKKVTDAYSVLPVDVGTVSVYGSIKAALRKNGKPIPENDIWIAAIAIQHNLALVTRDKHFNEVDGLKIGNW